MADEDGSFFDEDGEPRMVFVQPEAKQYTLTDRAWAVVIALGIMLFWGAVFGWFGHLLWNYAGFHPHASFGQAVAVFFLLRFTGIALNLTNR